MSTKDRIIKILEESQGAVISGETLAQSIGVSRAAVWKSISELRKEGFIIDAATNNGYSLSPSSDVISIPGILNHCTGSPINGEQLHLFKTLDSTNLTAKKMALDGAPHGTIVISEQQTAGRGRMGRDFFSPASSGIYMSMLLKPTFDTSRAVLITTAASVAVSRAIEATTGFRVQIKWVNDLYLKGKKICGILTEGVTNFETNHIDSIVLGIGINFRAPETAFPEELAEIAGALFTHDSSDCTRNQLIGNIITEMFSMIETLEDRQFIQEYKERSLVLGKEINVIKGGELFPATALDIDLDGGLVVNYKNDNPGESQIATLNSGEISIRLLPKQ
ncbi:MAG: biotin--[acetyl-CoA-carboxylase] ligase [Anaerovorax sp.]